MRNYKGTSEPLRIIQGNAMDCKIIPNCRKPLKAQFRELKRIISLTVGSSPAPFGEMQQRKISWKRNSLEYHHTEKMLYLNPKHSVMGRKVEVTVTRMARLDSLTLKRYRLMPDAMTFVSYLAMPSPKCVFRRREWGTQKALSNDSISIECSNDRTSKRRCLQNHRENHDAPFNSDAAFPHCITIFPMKR